MFVDSARVTVRAGRGGDGCVSFRREKFVPRGGPDGGDGGRGGSIELVVDAGLNTLLHLHHRRLIKANNGRSGMGANKTGASGKDVVVRVPPGTVVRNALTGELVGDLIDDTARLTIARGGRGGRGNTRFASATNRVPRTAEPGEQGDELELELELKLLADIGLIGLPNAGKSTLLSRVSAARPKIASYPFTTLAPALGVMTAGTDADRTVVVADIPGLIEGAHQGAGLGMQFLRHIERCRALVHLVDLAEPSPIEERVTTIRSELHEYLEALTQRSWMLVGTKLDACAEASERLQELAAVAAAFEVAYCGISAVSGQGLDRFTTLAFELATRSEETH